MLSIWIGDYTLLMQLLILTERNLRDDHTVAGLRFIPAAASWAKLTD